MTTGRVDPPGHPLFPWVWNDADTAREQAAGSGQFTCRTAEQRAAIERQLAGERANQPPHATEETDWLSGWLEWLFPAEPSEDSSAWDDRDTSGRSARQLDCGD